MPTASVLVPVFNVPEFYLRRCIESVVGQTYQDFELILVDDGSTDSSGAICDAYAAVDARIRVIHQANSGLSNARNTAFDASTGCYVMFLDADDYIDGDTLENACRIVANHDVDIVMWDYVTEYPGRSIYNKAFAGDSRMLRKDECDNLTSAVLYYHGHISTVFAKLISKQYLGMHNIRHRDELRKGAEGIVFCLALYDYAPHVYYINAPYYHYIYNESSISHRQTLDNIHCMVECFEYIHENYIVVRHPELEPQLHTRMLYAIVSAHISGFFNPDIPAHYKERVAEAKAFLRTPIIEEALKHGDYGSVELSRFIALWMIQHKLWLLIGILARIRRESNRS